MTLRLSCSGAARLLAMLAFMTNATAAQVGLVPAPSELGDAVGEGKPKLRPERVGAQVVGGTYAGVAGYFVGRGVGTLATMMMSEDSERVRDQIVDGVGWVGAAFAIGGTVYAIGDMGAETGSFPQTMAGVTAGAAVSLVLSRIVFRGRMPADRGSAHRKWLMATLECSLPAIGGTIAFNASRKWQR